MRVFLTGSNEREWRWNISDFLHENAIDFFDAADYPQEFASIFKFLKILEGCDGVIACFSKWEPQHLQTVIELGYASKLAKEIMVVDRMRRKTWIHALPYTRSFPHLDGLKEHLTQVATTPKKTPRLIG